MPADGSPRILITRLSAIGDCVLTLPVASGLRRFFPNAFVAWAVERPSDQLLTLCPDIDHLIEIPQDWVTKPSVAWQLRLALRRLQFDTAIDPQGITKSAGLAWLSGANVRVGLSGTLGRELSRWLNNCSVVPSERHVVDRSLSLLEQIGVPRPPVEFRMRIPDEVQSRVDQQLADLEVGGGFAAINPGASWPSKMWELDRFAEVARHLRRHHGLACLVTWAGPAEYAMAEQIARTADGAVQIAPATNLQHLAALLQRAAFYLGCDTGPMHIAAAVGTRCIGLYGTTMPQDSGAYGQKHVAIQRWYQAGSSLQRRRAGNDAMRDISVQDVCRACNRLIQSMHRNSGTDADAQCARPASQSSAA